MKMKALVGTADGVDMLVEADDFEDENGRSLRRCICEVNPAVLVELLRFGKLKPSDLDKDRKFVKVYPREAFQLRGIWAQTPRILLTRNFDGSEARFAELWGAQKDKLIASLEMDKKFWQGKAAIEHERALKAGKEVSQYIKETFGTTFEPVRNFIRKSQVWMGPQRAGISRPITRGPPMTSEEEAEEVV